jgi:hypothetical protein
LSGSIFVSNQGGAGLMAAPRGVIITHCDGLRIELPEGDCGLKESLGLAH